MKGQESKKQINKVLKYHDCKLDNIRSMDRQKLEETIESSESILRSLGYSPDSIPAQPLEQQEKKELVVPSWESLCKRAEDEIKGDIDIETLFTEEELASNSQAIKLLNQEYNQIHKLDKGDYAISAIAAIVGGAVDLLMVGIPHSELSGKNVSAPLSDYIRKHFEKVFPPGALEGSFRTKVPYDAQDNRHTVAHIEGLSSYYHRLYSLGHDPLLGFVIGVLDIVTGRMTTIDKLGNLVSQPMEIYSDRKEINIFAAFAKQLLHLKSDITTSMGLPVPLMGLFNLLQVGNIGDGDDKKTIAEIVQEMYHEGYDFIHFCSMSIPAMLVEVIVRICYTFKRMREGHSLKESVAFTCNREKHPKLGTMLFISHSGAIAINAGKVYFKKDPCAINYMQWAAFAKYAYMQLKWVLIQKPEYRDAFVHNHINAALDKVLASVDDRFNALQEKYIIVYEPPSN